MGSVDSSPRRVRASGAVPIARLLLLGALCVPQLAAAARDAPGWVEDRLLWLAALTLFAAIAGVVVRLGQPAVLGELLLGILLGNLSLIGFDFFEPVEHAPVFHFLAEFGAVLLLFQIGLETDVESMKAVGLPAAAVGVVGVLVPFLLGAWVAGPALLPGLHFNTYLFLGAALTATSVGITARIFRDMDFLHRREARIVLGAAVLDDVLGLMVLAVATGFVSTGTATAGAALLIVLKALAFLAGALLIGRRAASLLSSLLARIRPDAAMKLTVVISFCLFLSYAAHAAGLAPIIGAFAAGLILEHVHFRDFAEPEIVRSIRHELTRSGSAAQPRIDALLNAYAERDVEQVIAPIAHLLIPVFFVITGMQLDLRLLSDPRTVLIGVAVTILAIAGKLVSGLVAGKVNKWIVGLSMVPRGEVGLIFAVIGKELGAVSDQLFAIIIIVVILTTFVSPPLLAGSIRRGARGK